MSLQDFYLTIDGDYESTKGRLAADDRIEKFVMMFFADESFDNLGKAIEDEDWALAFRCAHTLKGNAKNVGVTHLGESASELAEALRPDDNGNPPHPELAPSLYLVVKRDWDAAVLAKELISQ